jgi:CSLREA domain-containing protein
MVARALRALKEHRLRFQGTLAFVLAFVAPPAANASIFAVDSMTDAPDASLGNGTCATAGGDCTLRAAIQEANQDADSDTIQMPVGIYTLTLVGNDDLAVVGDLDVRNPVAIEGAGADVTVIEAGGIDRVFEMPLVAGAPLISIDSLTIRGGAVTDAPGAGIAHQDDDGALILDSVTLTANHVTGTVSAATGGAISVNGGGNVTLLDCLLFENSADRGGAIFTNSTFTLAESTLTDNVARVGSAVESYGSTVIHASTIWGNQATGGAAVDLGDGQLVLRNSTLSDNTATSATVVLFGDLLSVERSTIFDNASDGSIRAITGIVEAIGTVLAGSLGTVECDADGGILATLEYNLDDDGSCVPSGTSITAANPGLGPLADNGGPTLTHAPLPGSPLIDAAEASPICTGADQRGLPRPVDAGGDPTARCDIGSVELAPEPAGVALAIASLISLALRSPRGPA